MTTQITVTKNCYAERHRAKVHTANYERDVYQKAEIAEKDICSISRYLSAKSILSEK
jgi:hypothetical protein